MLITTSQFCSLVGISYDRFERRRLRERAAADLAEALGEDDRALMPIASNEFGRPGQYDALDAVRLRSVIELELAGMAFGGACRFIRGAGIGPAVMYPTHTDILAALWLLPGGTVRRVCGDSRDIARATPSAPLASISVNISAIRGEIAKRAAVQLGLRIDGINFKGPAA